MRRSAVTGSRPTAGLSSQEVAAAATRSKPASMAASAWAVVSRPKGSDSRVLRSLSVSLQVSGQLGDVDEHVLQGGGRQCAGVGGGHGRGTFPGMVVISRG
ncbi:hypothetical protein ACIBG7_34895 [Nonomuraea sp. NPDC050328]|uniref:hypothetical protein n=1 Tax=Nonomuraea sp. NPDC050328 TaxID=3364361 RepID=UPI0037AD5131